MRILLISRCPPYPLHLGDRLIIWHVARELSSQGHQVDLIAYAQTPDDHEQIAHYNAYFDRVTLIDETRRTPLNYLSRIVNPARRFPKSADQSWSAEMWQTITEHVTARQYDIAHLFGSVQVYEFFHALGGLPAIITPYESFSLYLTRLIAQGGGLNARIQRSVARRLEAFMFAPYRAVTVVAEPDRVELLRLNPRLNVTVIPNGIDLSYFQPMNTPRDAHTLIFTGNFEYPPNVHAALYLIHEILPAVRRQMPAAKLQLVGNAPPPELMRLQSEHVEITGRVPDLRPYLAGATAFVCPLQIGAGIKNKVLEALAMGTPVIGTPIAVDGIAVTDGESAIVAPVDQFAEKIIALLNDPAKRQRLSDNSHRLIVSRYSWAQSAAAYLATYEAALTP